MTKRTKGQSIGERKNDENSKEDDEAVRKNILSTAVNKCNTQCSKRDTCTVAYTEYTYTSLAS